ncbi:MAG: hypothetical protein Q9164_006906 [Protoblastenia rupestris]
MAPLSTEELLTLDASELANMLAKGRITSVSLVEQLLHQISKVDKARMNLRAVLSVAPRDILIETASKLDDERRQGKLRGPLHGIPILVKVWLLLFMILQDDEAHDWHDAINTHPDLGMPTTSGSFALLKARPAKSAGVVEEILFAQHYPQVATHPDLPKALKV